MTCSKNQGEEHMTKDDALRLAQRALSNKNAPARVVYEALAAIRKVLQQGEGR